MAARKKKPAKAMSNAGWSKPPTAAKWHYFLAGEDRSLCLRYGFNLDGDREDTNDAYPDNCAACRKKLAPIRAKVTTNGGGLNV